MTIESHHYRSDIDGLRALAIVPVVLYHAGVPGFAGGFVGVDVFFVISGYLITSIIEREIREDRFSIVGFYERRVRRIIPALFTMMAACAIASFFLLYPTEYQNFSRSLISTTLFVSSIQFRREGGYFDVDSAHKPLLHTWSLSVEEIFYLFFPVLSLLIWRCCKAYRKLAISVVAILSFLACVGALLLDNKSRAAFFLAHFRAWEFLIGALLALSTIRVLRRRSVHALSLAGVVLIGAAVLSYSDSTVFPGAAALLPCLGAAAIIIAGQHRPSFAGHVLSSKPLVFTGLISYSLYLWHWPILVFAGLWLGRRPSGLQTASLIAASLVLAALSWRYVERPFRGKSGWLSRRALFAASAGAGALIVAVGLHGEMSNGWISRYPDALRVILESGKDRDPRQNECLKTKPDVIGCIYGQKSSPPEIALWGDSYGAAYAVMLGQLAETRGSSVLALTLPSCPPANGWQFEDQRWRSSCERFQGIARKMILETESIHTVILAASFSVYARSPQMSPRFSTAFSAVVAELLNAGKRVVLVYPYPTLSPHTMDTMAKAAASGRDPSETREPLTAFVQDNREGLDLLDSLGESPRLLRIHAHTGLCDNTGCWAYKHGKPLYYDRNHISLTGAEMLAPLFQPLFKEEAGRRHTAAPVVTPNGAVSK